MTEQEKEGFLLGAMVGALLMAVFAFLWWPSREDIIRDAWRDGTMHETVGMASTQELLRMRDSVLDALEHRPDLAEAEASRQEVRRSMGFGRP